MEQRRVRPREVDGNKGTTSIAIVQELGRREDEDCGCGQWRYPGEGWWKNPRYVWWRIPRNAKRERGGGILNADGGVILKEDG